MHSSLMKVLFVFLIIGLLLAGCSGGSTPAPEGESIVPVVAGDFAVVAKGQVVPRESVWLSFLNSGELIEILVKVRDQVKEGDVLARLGNREQLEAQIANAEYELLQAQQALDTLQNDLHLAQNQALLALTDAKLEERDADRKVDNLPDEGRDFDRSQYEARLEVAQANLDQAQEEYDILQEGPDPGDLAAAESRIVAAEAQLTSVRASLENMDLHAPMDGTVAEVNLIVGEQMAAGKPVIMMADFSKWFVETEDLTEIEVVNVR